MFLVQDPGVLVSISVQAHLVFGRDDLAAYLRVGFDRVSRDEPGARKIALGEEVQ